MDIFILILSIAAIILSCGAFYFSYKVYAIQNKFFGSEKIKTDLTTHIQNYYKSTKEAIIKNEHLEKQIQDVVINNKQNLSSIVIRRFNPYEDTGGDLSFCIVLIDREKNGLMMTSLHGRDRTRIYTRSIVKGEINADILFDEKETLNNALKKL